jgi:putative membrane protein
MFRPACRPARTVSLSLLLPARGQIEEAQSLRRARRGAPLRENPNAVPGGQEAQVIPGPDAVLVGYHLGNGDLELAGDPSHILVLARIQSLSKRPADDREPPHAARRPERYGAASTAPPSHSRQSALFIRTVLNDVTRIGYHGPMHLLVSWIGLSLGLWLTAALVPGFEIKGVKGALVVGAVFGVLHWAIGWFIFTLIGIGTLFLGFVFAFLTRWIVTAIILKMADALTESLAIDSFRTALVGSAVLSVLSAIGNVVLR